MKTSKLPIQAAPVERNITGTAISNQNGVEASGLFDDILGGIGKVANVAAPIAGALAPVLGSLI
ncbi:MAG: hypothetical protein ACR9NN_17990 [Nostochopsis sp.]